MFIDEFQEDMKIHKVKFINEKKIRVMVLHIENLTKPLYQLFPKRLDFIFLFHLFFIFKNVMRMTDFKLPEVLHLGIG